MKKWLLAIMFILNGIALVAQPLFEARLDTDRVLIGEPLFLTLTAELNANDTYEWPAIGDTIDRLEVWSREELQVNKRDGKLLLSQKFEVASFDSGFYIIKPLKLIFGKDSTFCDPILLQVKSVEVTDDQPFYEIKEPKSVEYDWTPMILAASIGTILAIVLIFFLLRLKKKPKSEQEAPKDLRPPVIRFRDDLSAIETNRLWEGEAKPFYTQLTLALNTYLEKEENIAALESTTLELKPELMSLPWPKEVKRDIIEMLEESDMVKFAKAPAEVIDMHAHFSLVNQLCEDLYKKFLATEVKNTKVNA
jgi:hypothetical protein